MERTHSRFAIPHSSRFGRGPAVFGNTDAVAKWLVGLRWATVAQITAVVG
ncbi:MAG TPA: hypothetical protein VE083_03940 [Terriglobales bacterium]|nr:hypothetical protein [Terriglobales bacterium]